MSLKLSDLDRAARDGTELHDRRLRDRARRLCERVSGYEPLSLQVTSPSLQCYEPLSRGARQGGREGRLRDLARRLCERVILYTMFDTLYIVYIMFYILSRDCVISPVARWSVRSLMFAVVGVGEGLWG